MMTDSLKLFLDQLLTGGPVEIVVDNAVGYGKNPLERKSQSSIISCDRGAPPRLPSITRSCPSKSVVEIQRSQQKECQKKLHKQSRWNAIPNGKRKDSSISPVRRTVSLTFLPPKPFRTLEDDSDDRSPEKARSRTASMMQEVMDLIDDFEPPPFIGRTCSL